MEERHSLLHIIPSNKWGGVQKYAFDICRHYNDKGWEVTALTRNAVNIDSRFVDAGISLIHAPVTGFFNLPSVLTVAKVLRKMPKGNGTVHVHRYRDAFTALLAKKLTNRPDIRVIATRHNMRHGKNTIPFREVYRNIDAHVFVSQFAFERFAHGNSDIILPEERTFILHNSLNIGDCAEKAYPAGPVIAMYCGPLVAGKGIEILIDAMVKLRDLRLRLRVCGFGDPDFIDMLRRRAIARGVMDNIDWNIKPSGYESLAAECHFGIVPSTEMEACGMANLRFMAAGRPQVTTGIGAQTEYLENGTTAFFVPPADAGALAEAMRILATDPELRVQMGKDALQAYSDNLSWVHFIQQLDKIYNLPPIIRTKNQ